MDLATLPLRTMSRSSDGSDRPATTRSSLAGAVGGGIGAIVFGLVLWMGSPEVLSESIPAFYGIDSSDLIGWLFHIAHGFVLGGIFGFVVARPSVYGMVTATVETDILQRLSVEARFGLVGVVYGIAIWVVLPFIGLSLLGTVVDAGDVGMTGVATEMILGHVLFGVIVGIAFAALTPVKIATSVR